jgi:hypothetical protein
MFALNQTSVSRRPLVFPAVLEMALCATDCPLGVFSSPTNKATNPPPAYDTQIVSPKPIEMNTCTKTAEGEGDFSRYGLKPLIFRRLWESYSCTKTMNNSHEIILFQKNRGWGVPLKLYLSSEFPGGRREYQHDCSREINDVLSNAHSDFDNPCSLGSRHAATAGHMLRESVQHHTS